MKLVPIIVGIMLIIVALGMYGYYSYATVYYVAGGAPTIQNIGMFLTGTSTANPYLMNPNQAYPAIPTFLEVATSGLTQAQIRSVSVIVSGSVSSTLSLTFLQIDSSLGYLEYYYAGTFTSGGPGSSYTFTFTVVTTVAGTLTMTGYAVVGNLVGYVLVNGQNVTTSSIITVFKSPVNVTYVVTYPLGIDPNGLTTIVLPGPTSGVTSTFDDMIASYFDGTWTVVSSNPPTVYCSVPLTQGYGTYHITAYVYYVNKAYLVLNVFGTLGSGNSEVATMAEWAIGLIGAAFIAVGAILPSKETAR